MTSGGDWQEIKSELVALLELPDAAARRERLDRLRTVSAEQAAELEGLLAAGAVDEEFLETPASERLVLAVGAAPAAPPRIGPWRIEAEIGRGGMGTVYRGRRDDGAFEQTVAVKLVHDELASASLRRRFAFERRVLAGLEHPNIARLLDGGTTPGGVPYLVLEHVQGEAIDRYCDARALPVEKRLALFVAVCGAVHFAHQKLVLHRDIKSANVLVDQRGEPKLLDFGIAKLLLPEPAEEGLTALGVGRALTPEWASPEQLRGAPLATSSDVYSLGVLLHVLLTGARPHAHGGQSPEGFAEAIYAAGDVSLGAARQSPPPGVDAARLRGDLERIVARALAPEPERRYSTASELADDVGRFLSGQPVAAHPASLGYRARKFVGRHRAAVAAALIAVTSLVAATAVSVRQARLAERERVRAQRRFDDVRRLARVVLFDLHDALANVSGAMAARQLLVENALRYLDDLAREAGDEPGLLDELATAYERVAELQGMPNWPSQGRTGDALASLEQALAMRRRALGAGVRSPAARAAEARLLTRIGSVLAARGGSAEARARHREARALLQQLVGASPTTELRLDLAVVEVALGDDAWELGDIAGAAVSYEDARAAAAGARGADPGSSAAARQMGVIEQRLGDTAARSGHWQRALEHHSASLAMDEDLLRRDLGNAELERDLGTDLSRLGDDAFALGRLEEALAAHQRAGQLREKLLAAEPGDARALEDAAESRFQAARALLALGRRNEAVAAAAVAITRWRTLAVRDAQNARWRDELASSLTEVARWEASGHGKKAALGLLEEARAIRAKLAVERPDFASNRSALTELEGLLEAVRD